MELRKLHLAIAVTLTGSVANLAAQESDQEGLDLDTVTVTGTHIKGIDLEDAQPIFIIDREEIDESGADSVIDILKNLPQVGGGTGTFSTSTAGALSTETPVGSAGVSLRGLGTSSTLTLINGRRVSVASFAQGQESFVDVNTIPLAAIERIEVLPSGASAIYGADAVAGVINIILRSGYEGVEVSASYGDSAAGSDDSKYNVSVLAGASSERASGTLIVDYFNRNALYDRDRAETRNEIRPRQQGVYPSFNDLFFQFFDQTEEPGDGGCPADLFVPDGFFGEYCSLNRGQFVSTIDEFESLGITGLFDVDLNNGVRWFNEVMYTRNESLGTSSPAPFSRVPVDPARMDWPQDLIDDIVAEGGVDDISDFFGFPIYAWGSFPDPRQVGVETDSFRLVSGLEGTVGRFDWEAALSYGHSESEQSGKQGLYKKFELYNAMLGNLCSDGSIANVWDDVLSRSPTFVGGQSCEDRGLQTVLYNPFGGQAVQSDLANALIRTDAVRGGESQMWSIDFGLSGDLFQLPNGNWVKAAFGVEHREEEVKDLPSIEARATPDNPEPIVRFSFTEADYERDHNAIFGEFYAPLADSFDLQLAIRHDDYSDFGSDTNPKLGFRWQPHDDFVVRGSWSTSFRAPSLAQAGAGTTLSSTSIPCSEPGLAVACGGDNTGSVPILTEIIGNPDLQPENATNVGLGFAWQVSPDASFVMDYWRIDYENLVGIDEADFLRRAFAGQYQIRDLSAGDAPLPEGTPGVEIENGVVVEAHVPLLNFGFQDTDGFDLSYTQYFDTANAGNFRFLVDATYLNSFK